MKLLKSTTARQKNREKFVEWLKKRDPFMYAVTVKVEQLKAAKKQSVGGLFDGFNFGDFIKSVGTTIKDVIPSVISTVKDVAPAALQYRAQVKVLDANVQRAKNDLPPLDIQSYTSLVPTYNPTSPTAEHQRLVNDMATQTYRASTTSSLSNYLPYLAIAGVAAIFLMRKRGGSYGR